MVRQIELTQGYVALVDDEDYERVSAYAWHATGRRNYMYASRRVHGTRAVRIKMHHEILGVEPNTTVDHKNGNTLDNRRENLRVATTAQNIANQKARTSYRGGPISSAYRGVRKVPTGWRADICVNYKRIHVGVFKTEEAAARAWDDKAREVHGEFARLNFPDAEPQPVVVTEPVVPERSEPGEVVKCRDCHKPLASNRVVKGKCLRCRRRGLWLMKWWEKIKNRPDGWLTPEREAKLRALVEIEQPLFS